MINIKPNNDEVICPNCCNQFRAIPVNVQRELAEKDAEIARLNWRVQFLENPDAVVRAAYVVPKMRDEDPPACTHCGAMAGCCPDYPNCPNGAQNEKQP